MNVLDLFSGIGGFSLGLERAGMRTVAFCEVDPFCRRVLAKHWPGVPRYDDVRSLTADRLRADGIAADVICGGFPCQDISVAGKGAGIEGERSGLWSEYARIIGEVRPAYVIVENVAALLGRGLDRVLGDLAALGFDAEWHCIPASAVGAPHRRDRLWITANARRERGEWRGSERRGSEAAGARDRSPRSSSDAINVADAASGIRQRPTQGEGGHASLGSEDVANPYQPRLERWLSSSLRERATRESGSPIPDADSEPPDGIAEPRSQCGDWLPEPDVGRVAHGVPARVDRLRSLGNAVVPQIPEIIGRAIMSYDMSGDIR